MRHRPKIVLLMLGLLSGCAGDPAPPARDGPVPVLIVPASSPEGVPQVRGLVPRLRRLGARDVTVRRPVPGSVQIRALVPRDAIRSLRARLEIAQVVELVRRVGNVERRDLALVLTTDGGRKYELRGVDLDLRELDGARLEVEGHEWTGAVAPPPVPGLPTFIVFDWRRLD